MAPQKTDGNGPKSSSNKDHHNAPSDNERYQESSKAAQQALALRKKAHELRQAAAGALDPDERQHLLEEAINKEIEAESFGKTAKYLRSGAFQGLVAGTGIGIVPGATLGTLTGTLVGGTLSLITGGLGAGIGAAYGAIRGPMVDIGGLAGKAIKKVTGTIPGWKATPEQKATLEKMVGQAHDEDPPNESDLADMAEWKPEPGVGDQGQKQGWAEYGASYLPSVSGGTGANSQSNGSGSKQSGPKREKTQTHSKKDRKRSAQDQDARSSQSQAPSSSRIKSATDGTRSTKRSSPGAIEDHQSTNKTPNTHSDPTPDTQPRTQTRSQTRRAPRKLQVRSGESNMSTKKTRSERKPPRKLQVRNPT